jgi:hypothetical protein
MIGIIKTITAKKNLEIIYKIEIGNFSLTRMKDVENDIRGLKVKRWGQKGNS